MQMRGFTCGIDDLLIDTKSESNRRYFPLLHLRYLFPSLKLLLPLAPCWWRLLRRVSIMPLSLLTSSRSLARTSPLATSAKR